MRAVFFAPLFVLIVERLGRTVDVMSDLSHDVSTAHYPMIWQPLLPNRSWSQKEFIPVANYSKVPLSELARPFETASCPSGLKAVTDAVRPAEAPPTRRRIPKIIHQTSKSRCMTPQLARTINTWRNRLPDHEYYFHDDDAIDRLFNQDWPMFPHLASVAKCLEQGTARADLWRYLVLWEYGGIYADIDTAPNLFNDSSITDDHDSFFVIEQYHMLSQYFMAASPHHPVMFYAIHHALANIIKHSKDERFDAALITGPHTLHQGFQSFMSDVGIRIVSFQKGALPVHSGTFVGTQGRSVTAVGVASNQNEYVEREKIRRPEKIKEYGKMKMTHFWEDAKIPLRKSCLAILLEEEQLRFFAEMKKESDLTNKSVLK